MTRRLLRLTADPPLVVTVNDMTRRRERERTLEQIQYDVARKIAPWPRPGDQPLKAVAEASTGKKLGLVRFKR